MVLGALVSGWWATAFRLAVLVVRLALGLGLWRMKPWARTEGLAYSIFSNGQHHRHGATAGQFLTNIHGREDSERALASYPLPQEFFWFIAILSAGLLAMALWFLIKRKAAVAY